MIDVGEIVKVYHTRKYFFRVMVSREQISGIELYVLRAQQPLFGLRSDCHPLVDKLGRHYDLTAYIAQLDMAESPREQNQVLSAVRSILVDVVAGYCPDSLLLMKSLSR